TIGDRQDLVEIDSVNLAVRVRALVSLVPARDSDPFTSQPLVKFDRVLGHVAKSLHAGCGVLCSYAWLPERLSNSNHAAVTRRLGPAKRPSHADWLASDEARITTPMDLFELVEY